MLGVQITTMICALVIVIFGFGYLYRFQAIMMEMLEVLYQLKIKNESEIDEIFDFRLKQINDDKNN